MLRSLLILSFCAASLPAQTLSLAGRVLDANQLPIDAATVSLTQTGRKPQYAQTASDGRYSFASLPAGSYSVRILKPGFAELTQNINLRAAIDNLDFTLALAEVSTTVTVEDVAGKTTATRMDVPNLEVPIQVSSITSQVLEQRGVNDLVNALQNASGVSATRWYGMYEYYTIRGFNVADVQLVDGMRLEGNRINTQLNNVEQVDVLKGPSSILYGGQALSGAINIIRKKPAANRAYDVFYRGGRFNTHQVGLGATGPVGNWQRLLYRADVSFEDSDGWRAAAARRLNFSPSLTYLFSDRARVTLHQAFNRDRFTTDGGVPVGAIAAGIPLSFRFNTPQDFGRVDDSQTHVLLNINLNPNWEFRNGFLYRYTNDEYFSAETLTYAPALNQVNRGTLYFHHHRRPVLNQTDVLGHFNLFGMKHTVVGGYEYQDFYNFTDRSATRSVNIAPISLATRTESFQPFPNFPISRRDYFTNAIHAFFWQDFVQISKRLRLNVGGRFDDFGRITRNDPWANGAATSRGVEFRRNQTAYTYRAGLTYLLAENQQLYFSSASSFQPVTNVPADGRELVPETGRSFELGHRIQAFGGRFKVDTALYQIRRQNVVIALPNANFEQAGQQSARGLDLDINGNIGKGFRLIANYGYTLPRFDTFFANNRTLNLSGFRPRFTQRHASNLWLTKAWNNGWTASVGQRYLSSMFVDNANTQNWRLGGYSTFSGALSYRRSFYHLGLNADNLLGRDRYFVAGIYDGQVYPGTPLNVAATLRLFFR
ncbi:MAG: TonB-dependent receptor [Bryobacter sp.]|jgi:iron complex outermembrane receptor protein|nr:TonB-dependent receptor [Bryobacter sp. CoA8 C33]